MALNNLFALIERIEKIDIASNASDIINENGDYIVSLLKGQLSKGKDGDGNDVTVFGRDFYSDLTVFQKEMYGSGILGKETRWITNYFSGTFYNSIYVFASGKTFIFDSDVPYFEKILLQSGVKIMELSKENLKIFNERVLSPTLKAEINLLLRGI